MYSDGSSIQIALLKKLKLTRHKFLLRVSTTTTMVCCTTKKLTLPALSWENWQAASEEISTVPCSIFCPTIYISVLINCIRVLTDESIHRRHDLLPEIQPDQTGGPRCAAIYLHV